jgi:hypothetical protein
LDSCLSLYKFVDQTLIEICGPNLVRNLLGWLVVTWKKNLSNSNTSLFIQAASLTFSVLFVIIFLYYY